MKNFSVLSLILTVFLFLTAANSLAAGGASSDLPGGVVLGYWQCGNGISTGVAIQNVKDFPVGVHFILYDQCSREIMNFTVPLSGRDIWGGTISCEGGEIVIEGLPSHFEGPNNGSETRHAPKTSNFGYIVASVTQVGTNKLVVRDFGTAVRACDGQNAGQTPYHCNNDDPRDDLNWKNQVVHLPNALIMRLAIGNISSGVGMFINGISLIDFTNLGTYFGNDDDNGIILQLEELAAFAPDLSAVGGGRFALGSANGTYWASYNQSCYNTTFVLIFPQSGVGCTNDIKLNLQIYDDNEVVTSGSLYVPEVAKIPVNKNIISYLRGMIRIKVDNTYRINYDALGAYPLPMFGYSIYEAPGVMMALPIVPEQKIFCVSGNCYIIGANVGPANTAY